MPKNINERSNDQFDCTILIVSAWLPGGGIEKVILNLNLINKFKKIKVLSLSKYKKYDWDKDFSKDIEFEDCFCDSKTSINSLTLGIIKSFLSVKKMLKHTNPKYIFFTHSFLIPIFFFIRTSSKIYFWPHNNLFNKSTKLKLFLKFVFYKLFKNSITGILSVNKQIFEEANSIGFNDNRLVYNPIGQNYNNLFNFKSDLKKLIHIGYLDDRKNTSFILKAFALTSNKEVTLDIIGDGDLLNDLVKEAESLGLKKRVNFKGFIDLQDTLIDCSGLVMSSKSEGFSMIISDALKSGIPVFLPNNLDISSFVKSGNYGDVFSLSTPNNLALILDKLDFEKFNSANISKEYISLYGDEAYCNRLNL